MIRRGGVGVREGGEDIFKGDLGDGGWSVRLRNVLPGLQFGLVIFLTLLLLLLWRRQRRCFVRHGRVHSILLAPPTLAGVITPVPAILACMRPPPNVCELRRHPLEAPSPPPPLILLLQVHLRTPGLLLHTPPPRPPSLPPRIVKLASTSLMSQYPLARLPRPLDRRGARAEIVTVVKTAPGYRELVDAIADVAFPEPVEGILGRWGEREDGGFGGTFGGGGGEVRVRGLGGAGVGWI